MNLAQCGETIYKMVFCYQNVPTTVWKNCSSDQEKLLKFEAEGREFAKILRSLEHFVLTVKGQNNFSYKIKTLAMFWTQ